MKMRIPVIPDSYPHFLGNVWMNGYRARRIVEVLESKVEVSIDDCRALHVDYDCIPGREFVLRLAGLSSSDPEVQHALELLRAWDGWLGAHSTGGMLYEVTRYALVRNLVEPALGKELTLHWMGQGFNPVLMHSDEFFGQDTVTILRLLDQPDSWWMRQAGGREAVLLRSLKQAVEWARAQLGPDLTKWQWGKIHRAIFPHAMGLQKPLDEVFNRGPLPVGGDADTPCQAGFGPEEPYDNTAWAPGFRQIVDLSDLSRSLFMVPPGQSGHLASVHYDDLAEPWAKGEYVPMLWTREQVDREAEGGLELTP
jgi:penicillin amidase